MLLAVAALVLQNPFAKIEAILANRALEGATVAVVVADAKGNVLFDRNGDRKMVPGSNQKLFTASFALSALGPAFRNETRLWREKDRTVIDAPGDPTIAYFTWLGALARLGGRSQMPVYVRQGYRVGVPPTWELDDLPNRYAAQVTALTTERGGFELWTKDGEPELRPAAFGVRIERVGNRSALGVRFDPFSRLVTVEGTLPKGEKRLDTLAIPNPDVAVASLFGDIIIPTADVPERMADVKIPGRTVADLISLCLAPSDNQLAEHLLLLAGGSTYPIARKAMLTYLTSTVGIPESQVRPMDGSGMSRQNLLTASALVRLLVLEQRKPTATLWLGALARPGAGTLENRLKGIDFSGKTGTLTGVSSLSGYVRRAGGERLVVSILMNQYTCPAAEARAIQDAIITELASIKG